jgi:phosphopantothenoylcysteine decarboxylase/phosphopantothenate--cysteine ligase
MLSGKNILLGITGSIAAYKAAFLLRLLKKEGADVRVILTPYGKEFITPVTLAALSEHPVRHEFFEANEGTWHSHVDMGTWADLLLIAPATANTLAKMARGLADNLLLTTYLSARCPVMIAPAMDLDMYQHPATRENIKILSGYGNLFIEPGTGELASGLHGKGRMEEPEKIIEIIKNHFKATTSHSAKLSSKKILVTAGPTHEAIDPVRFIGNRSSGKMGYAIAEELANRGAEVILISGPVKINRPANIQQYIQVNSADEMHSKATSLFTACDGAILAAAVSDFKPSTRKAGKIKSDQPFSRVELEPTPDIAMELGKNKGEKILAGFALETENELENARGKLKRKNFDFIVLNSLNDKGAGFETETNKITILDNKNNTNEFSLKIKNEVAIDIVNKFEEYF